MPFEIFKDPETDEISFRLVPIISTMSDGSIRRFTNLDENYPPPPEIIPPDQIQPSNMNFEELLLANRILSDEDEDEIQPPLQTSSTNQQDQQDQQDPQVQQDLQDQQFIQEFVNHELPSEQEQADDESEQNQSQSEYNDYSEIPGSSLSEYLDKYENESVFPQATEPSQQEDEEIDQSEQADDESTVPNNLVSDSETEQIYSQNENQQTSAQFENVHSSEPQFDENGDVIVTWNKIQDSSSSRFETQQNQDSDTQYDENGDVTVTWHLPRAPKNFENQQDLPSPSTNYEEEESELSLE